MPWGYISNSLDMAMACGTQSRVDWERINKIFLKMRISGLERWLGGGEDQSLMPSNSVYQCTILSLQLQGITCTP